MAPRVRGRNLLDVPICKTCVLRALNEALSPAHFRVHYVAHVTLGRRDFYRQLCYVLAVEPKATPAAMWVASSSDIS